MRRRMAHSGIVGMDCIPAVTRARFPPCFRVASLLHGKYSRVCTG